MNGRGVSKNLTFANYYKIPYVLVVGENEIKSGKFNLKNMESGEQKEMTVDEIIQQLN